MRGGDLITESGSGELLAEISRAFVQLYKDNLGKGPTKARTYVSGDVIVCLLQGGLSQGERTLRDAGRGDAVSDQREAMQEVLRRQFIETIERITGRKVNTFISGVDLHTETNAELFVLEPLHELETGDEREAVHAWAEQTRNQSRVLREEQVALRERQAGLRRERPRTAGAPPKTPDDAA